MISNYHLKLIEETHAAVVRSVTAKSSADYQKLVAAAQCVVDISNEPFDSMKAFKLDNAIGRLEALLEKEPR